MTDLVIFGCGGFGRIVSQVIQDVNRSRVADRLSPEITVLGFLDDKVEKIGEVVAGMPVLGGIEWLVNNPGVGVVIAVGSPNSKRSLFERLQTTDASFPVIRHPDALIGRTCSIGEGSIICSRNVLTADVNIGTFVTVNVGCSLAHDVMVERFATLAPNSHLASHVHVGEGADLGTNALVGTRRRIGSWSRVGAGASVICDVPAYETFVGVPAMAMLNRQSPA